MREVETAMSGPTQDAWMEGIVRRNDRDLKRYLAQRIGNRTEVEDLAQEIYLRLLRIERKDLIRSPEALLFHVASNAIHEWRLLARNRLPHSPSELEALESCERDPSVDIWRAELARALAAALERLSPKCRAVVLLTRPRGRRVMTPRPTEVMQQAADWVVLLRSPERPAEVEPHRVLQGGAARRAAAR